MERVSALSPSSTHSRLIRSVPVLIASMLLGACASSPPAEEPAAAPPAPPPAVAKPAPAPAAPAPVYREPAPRLNPAHPDRYVVVKGDTLWDISAMFLKDPWYWPEIWYANPQIANPHLIYPGDVISLVYIDGKPRLVLERGGTDRLSPRVRAEPLDQAIQTIPYEIIQAFLSKPSVLDKDTIENAPYIMTSLDGHLAHGAGNEVYVRGADFAGTEVYSVMRVGEELRDPDDGDLLGYQGIYVGEGTIVRTGDPATLFLNSTEREAMDGSKLLPAVNDFPLYFAPRSPEQPIEGSIIAVFDGVSIVGQYQIVTLNRGSADGLDQGHVLAVYQGGRTERDPFSKGLMFKEKVTLPEEYAGLLMVFRVFDEISYGLIVRAESPINVLDMVRNP